MSLSVEMASVSCVTHLCAGPQAGKAADKAESELAELQRKMDDLKTTAAGIEERGMAALKLQRECEDAVRAANDELVAVEAQYEAIMQQMTHWKDQEAELSNVIDDFENKLAVHRDKVRFCSVWLALNVKFITP